MPDLLFPTEGNPVPDNTRAGRLTMSDGTPLRYALFAAATRPLKGTVVVLTGRNECIEKYFETARDLTARGFGVLCFDWRGQGGSGRMIRDPMRGYVDSFDEYVTDLDRIFQEVALPDCRAPFYILAHSTGALVALLAAPQLISRVRRMVLIAPPLRFHGRRASNKLLGWAAGALYALGLGSSYLGGGPRPREAAPFEGNKLTSDPGRYSRNQAIYAAHPELALGGPTVAWIRATLIAAETVSDPEFLARIHIPTLMVAAGADTVVSTAEVEEYSRRFRSGSLVTVDGARHEILQEADFYREQFLAAFDAFIPGSGAPDA